MPNQNVIVAYPRDSRKMVKSVDGATWKVDVLSDHESIKGFGGAVGKFIYITNSNLTPRSLVVYTNIDLGITWHAGVLPSPTQACIVAIANNATTLFYAYDGSNFIKGPDSV